MIWEQAKRYIPGGVNSPVRAFGAVGGEPFFVSKAKGPYLYDNQGKPYIDYVMSWGASILGHAPEAVLEPLKARLALGLGFGVPTELEVELAQWLCTHVPNVEQVRLVNSGTEASMSAIRLSRGATGRDYIIKFAGCYHGHVDSLLVQAGSGALTFGQATSKGVPESFAQSTMVLPFNDSLALQKCFEEMGDQIAGVIIEPIAGNMNFIPARYDFLRLLRECCTRYGSVLIFDEVMSGFRVAFGGAQEHYGIDADLVVMGKIMGGGLPVGAFGGKQTLMSELSPLGGVYQAGTLSGNPMTAQAGLSTLQSLSSESYSRLQSKCEFLLSNLKALAERAGVPFYVDSLGGMFGFFFATGPIENLEMAVQADEKSFCHFFHAMLEAGVYFAPSRFEAGFMSLAHDDEHLYQTLSAAEKVFAHWPSLEKGE